MTSIRRWYIYLVCAISIQAVSWALIALLRTLLVFDPDPATIAFQIAVIIIGSPVFIVHWWWVRRLMSESAEERGSLLRRVYLYVMQAAFLGPVIANLFDLLRSLLGGKNSLQSYDYSYLAAGEIAIYHAAALVVLAALWWYHQRLIAEESESDESSGFGIVRRLFILSFSATGLVILAVALIYLVRWLLLQIGPPPSSRFGLNVNLSDEVVRLVIGLSLWLLFWRQAQALFKSPMPAIQAVEQASSLRKFYLYSTIFIAAIFAVTNATIMLAGFLRSWLGLEPQGDYRQPLPIILCTALIWAFHAFVLRKDTESMQQAPRQAAIRRLYQYLVAGIGLTAALVGLGGDISVLLRSINAIFGNSLRDTFAWFTAALVAGLPVWGLAWRSVQQGIRTGTAHAEDARSSLVRKIYLYLFIFAATMTVLIGTIYIVSRLVGALLGEDPPTIDELGQAIAFVLIAVGVWLYHGQNLRLDNQLTQQAQVERLEQKRILLLDIGSENFSKELAIALTSDFPGLIVEHLHWPPSDGEEEQAAFFEMLNAVDVIVSPWLTPTVYENPHLVNAIATSHAHKLLLPISSPGWNWIGVDNLSPEGLQQQARQSIKQLLNGEEIRYSRPLGAGVIVGIILGILILFQVITFLFQMIISLLG